MHLSLEEDLVVLSEGEPKLTLLDEALERLAAVNPRKARVVEMRLFGGLSVEEAAEALNLSAVTVRAGVAILAKTWLMGEIGEEKGDGT